MDMEELKYRIRSVKIDDALEIANLLDAAIFEIDKHETRLARLENRLDGLSIVVDARGKRDC